jgi:hypothetical protein
MSSHSGIDFIGLRSANARDPVRSRDSQHLRQGRGKTTDLPRLRQQEFKIRMLRRGFSIPSRSRLGFLPSVQKTGNSALISCRGYSVASAPFAKLDASSLTIENTKHPKALTPQNELIFGHSFTGKLVQGILTG